ncbi:unnamed protein product [Rotaria magnacalcarata]|uniref:b(0,+)-type amino acid transporter 1 n=1 Tax=Rotaria magnacalcarata TaxID=392030 RepID=A0A819NFJ5_9BILA|nr:unnamed protein product [Rotaria magnacalcarata]CAF3996847.1 unnamed protein product [Rotaria magnacalcarata]
MGKVVSPNLSKVESDSISRHRRGQSPTTDHRHKSISSITPSDPLTVTLPADEFTLQRHLGLPSGVCLIIGVIIGAGIFISPKQVLANTGSVGLCLTVWAVSGVIALLGALCYADIGTVIPRNGAEVAYLKEGIGSVHPLAGDISAYLYNWANTFILKPASVSILTITFAEYFLLGIMGSKACGPPKELIIITAIFIILILVNINSLSVSAANRLNIIFVVCKVLTVMTVIIVGFIRLGQGKTEHLENAFEGTTTKLSGIALAFYNGLFAYDGWNSLNSVTEELKNPKRNLWLSIVLALPTLTILYVFTNISYFTVLSKHELLVSDAVALSWGDLVLKSGARALVILISISALGSANGTLFAASRNCMVGAQYGYLPEVFACIQSKRLTPLPSIALQGFIAIIFCFVYDIESLIDFFSFAAWIFYGLTFFATLCCKSTKKNVERVLSAPVPLIVFMIIVSIYLVIAPVIADPQYGYLSAAALILSGLIFYYPFVYLKMDFKIITSNDSVHRHGQSVIIENRRASTKFNNQPELLTAESPKDEVVLKRRLGLFSGVCIVIGTIIGSGIFISPKSILEETKSVGLCLIIWTICGLISILGALCYAEIGAVIPRNGAEVAYLKEGIGSVHERTGDILAYLFIWTSTLITIPSTIAVISLTFSRYFLSGVMGDCEPSKELVTLFAIFTILMLININAISVSAANRLNIIFVICKVLTIMTVIIVGLVRIGQGHTLNLKHSFDGTTTKPFGVALAFYKGLFAYGGWNNLNSVTEELKNPKRNLWLSVVLGLPSVIVLYVLTNISYFTVMNKVELLSSDAVAVTWAQVALGPVVRALPILISISALGSASAILFGGARCCMVGAQYGYLPELFACVQSQRLTPLPGVVLLVGFLAIAYSIPSDLYALIDFFSFSVWIFYGLTFVATLCCKFTKKDVQRMINVPIPLVIVIILISIYLIIVPVISYPSVGFLIAALVILFGLVFYYPFVYRKIELQLMKKTSSSCQVFFKLQRGQINIE